MVSDAQPTPVVQQARRKTLINPRIGMVREVPWPIPHGPFGNEIERDEASASSSIHDWPSLHQPARSHPHLRALVETNRRAVSKEARTSSEFRQYQQTHMIVRKRSSLMSSISNPEVTNDGSAGRRCSIPLGTAPYLHKSRLGIYSGIKKDTAIVFGERTAPPYSSAKLCVTGAFTCWENDEANYPLIRRRRKAKKKQAVETKASQGHHHSTEGAPASHTTCIFAAVFSVFRLCLVSILILHSKIRPSRFCPLFDTSPK